MCAVLLLPPQGFSYVLKRARKAATSLKGKMTVAIANNDAIELQDFGHELKSQKSDLHIAIHAGDDRYGAPAGTAFSGAALEAFAKKYLAGELTPFVKPDPPPMEDDPTDDPPEDEEDMEGANEDGGEE